MSSSMCHCTCEASMFSVKHCSATRHTRKHFDTVHVWRTNGQSLSPSVTRFFLPVERVRPQAARRHRCPVFVVLGAEPALFSPVVSLNWGFVERNGLSLILQNEPALWYGPLWKCRLSNFHRIPAAFYCMRGHCHSMFFHPSQLTLGERRGSPWAGQ